MKLYKKMKAAIEKQEGVSLVTITNIEANDSSKQQYLANKILVGSNNEVYSEFGLFDIFRDLILKDVEEAYRLRKSKTYKASLEDIEIEYYIEVYPPPLHLIIAGAGHVAKPTVEIAKLTGFSVTVVDDRKEFATKDHFPNADEVICRPFLEYFREFNTNSNTYIILVTRGHKHDVLILPELFNQEAAYIGMIGSRRRISGVFSQLKQEYPDQSFDNIYAPIGLDIGAQTPEEIGVSIIAEVLKVKNERSGLSLREKVPFFIAKKKGEKNE